MRFESSRPTPDLHGGHSAADDVCMLLKSPGPPPASGRTTEARAIPEATSHAPIMNQHGQTVTLASLRGKTVMVVPFLTLCTEICPLTTGNLLQVEQSLRAAHLADTVAIVEVSVDSERDTPARLSAYAQLTRASWELVTETPDVLHTIANFFVYQRVPEGNLPSIDWLTRKPSPTESITPTATS